MAKISEKLVFHLPMGAGMLRPGDYSPPLAPHLGSLVKSWGYSPKAAPLAPSQQVMTEFRLAEIFIYKVI